MVFVDTPGVLKGAKDALSKQLAAAVKASLKDVDVIAYIVDPTREIGQEEHEVMHMIERLDIPKVLVINKIDLHPAYIDFYRDLGETYTAVVEVSALRGTHVHKLVAKLFEFLPEGEYYYPEHQLTDMPNRIWLAELIREKLFLRLRQEVPYSTHVEVTQVDERDNGMLYIAATVFTTDDRYKRMIIGKGGRGIREIGQSTRKELEGALNGKVYLDLTVEVNPHWMLKFE